MGETDLIDRQAAIDVADKFSDADGCNGSDVATDIISGLISLPSAQQKPLKYTGESICMDCQTVNCDGCMYEPMKGEQE